MPNLVKEDAMTLLCHFAKNKEMKATIKRSLKGASVASTGAIIGGLFGGPPGVAVGGVIGGLLAWSTSKPFKPVSEILMELSPAEQLKLLRELTPILKHLDWKDATDLINKVMSNDKLQQQLQDMLVNFFKTQLKTDVQFGF
ncbi:protein C19orf12 homolog [Phyllostomus hastatus]|uniref:protein C19orf12 homolog n=1 Tax=Phyllostomus hastatus TaxID=9423 RepID=UPI001E685B24|nr:protein C19orf12 homolog [Phyllostomus hastatus]